MYVSSDSRESDLKMLGTQDDVKLLAHLAVPSAGDLESTASITEPNPERNVLSFVCLTNESNGVFVIRLSSPDFKAKVALEALRGDLTVQQIAAKHKLSTAEQR